MRHSLPSITLAVYSRGALQRRKAEEEKERKDGRTLRNLTTPHRVVGNKETKSRIQGLLASPPSRRVSIVGCIVPHHVCVGLLDFYCSPVLLLPSPSSSSASPPLQSPPAIYRQLPPRTSLSGLPLL